MTRTTSPRPIDVEAEFPELSGYRSTCTRLHLRPGTPGPFESSVGGGRKVGGYASWNVTGPSEVTCSCGEFMQPLLKIDSRECDSGTLSWVPLEDRELINESEANVPTPVTVGRGGSLNIFSCPADPAHEQKTILQG